MSGGVDSAVTAYLLKEQGYNVVGLFMHNWEEQARGQCTAADDWEDALATATHIGVPIYSINFAAEYVDRVFKHFISEYAAGRTPNPDVLCNREIKFDAFLKYALDYGDMVATGHYCDISHDGGQTKLLKAADDSKDQTYFLNQVTTAQLEKVLFPLGKLQKSEVRQIAEQAGLTAVAKKKDSTGICFIGERKFKEFLSNYLPAQKGKIVTADGKHIGEHDGLMYYTLGQRRGLNIGGLKDFDGKRWYVIGKNMHANQLIVSCGEGEELFSQTLDCDVLNFIGFTPTARTFKATAKVRYRQPEQPCTIHLNEDNSAHIVFDVPQRAITAGQYVVVYMGGEQCIGGAVIKGI